MPSKKRNTKNAQLLKKQLQFQDMLKLRKEVCGPVVKRIESNDPSAANQAHRPYRSRFIKTALKKLGQSKPSVTLNEGFFQAHLPKENVGMVAILHTFGKDLKFHPHVHVLTNARIPFGHKFNRIWRNTILANLSIYSNAHYYGYYVWSTKQQIQSRHLSRYIARYVRHPAIANGRILKYSGRNVTFFYRDANEDTIIIRKPIFDFIACLIQHIPPAQFKMIRHYGAYARSQIRNDY